MTRREHAINVENDRNLVLDWLDIACSKYAGDDTVERVISKIHSTMYHARKAGILPAKEDR